MSKILGQQVIVENKAGAGTIIGFDYVARQAPADGYTVTSVPVESLALLPITTKDLRFDPLKDLSPVIGLSQTSFILGSPSRFPWKNSSELVAYAKANPGKLNWGAPSPYVRVMTEVYLKESGVTAAYIPYSAAGPYIQALASGDIQIGFVSEQQAISLGDKMKVLGITGERRRPPYVDVPTFSELGLPQIRGNTFSLSVRSGTPAAVIEKLYSAASRALQDPQVKLQFSNMQLEITNQRPEVAAKEIAEKARFFAEVAQKIGLRPE
jgi:tripartite-type tricarboxylate transporter receptor subunit TctC